MNIVAVDDEALALNSLVRVLKQVFEDAPIKGFQKSREALEMIQELSKRGERLDYAFLDVEMRGISGIELAKCIKGIFPNVRIMFISAYDHYACQAYQVHAKGYILKPVTKELLEESLDSMEVEWRDEIEKKSLDMPIVSIHTFGNFDVFVNKKLLTFERSKSKELLAYLIDRKGAGVTTAEIAAVLWEDMGGKRATNNAQQVIHSLMSTLKQAGIRDIVIKKWNYLAVDPIKVVCDYYEFLQGNLGAINTYMGEYMCQYSWAETTTAALENKIKKEEK